MEPPLDFKQALRDPSSVFANPEDVLARADLSDDQKIEILRSWEYDASEEAVAEEEGMRGHDSDLLRSILLTLERIAPGMDIERRPPTKQGGI